MEAQETFEIKRAGFRRTSGTFLNNDRNSGMRSSAYKNIIPERLFSTDENPAEGVSTTKALSVAMVQGQKIYTLTKDNADQLANITIDDDARSEISQALSLGMEVIVHEKPIILNGWKGSGYSIIDSDYGLGAYRISGGAIYSAARGLLQIMGLIGLNNGLASLASYGFMPLFVSGPIGWAVSAAIGTVVALVVLYSMSDYGPGSGCENCDSADFMDLMSAMVMVGLAATVLFGGLGALVVLFSMVILLSSFMTKYLT